MRTNVNLILIKTLVTYILYTLYAQYCSLGAKQGLIQ